ncbi:MAG: hypothetical protein IPF65_06075 [Polaromonas sp.]|nr:hypothetical protein [Polaromonas sp.]
MNIRQSIAKSLAIAVTTMTLVACGGGVMMLQQPILQAPQPPVRHDRLHQPRLPVPIREQLAVRFILRTLILVQPVSRLLVM